MTLPHFFVDGPLVPDPDGCLAFAADRELLKHLQSLRVRRGEHIVLVDEPGHGLELELLRDMDKPGAGPLEARVLRSLYEQGGARLTLVQGISKSDHMDQTVRQATELGVAGIVPLACERSTVRLDEKGRQQKRERWKRIARAAAEQSARLSEPHIEMPCDLPAALALLAGFDGVIVAWEEAGSGPLGDIVGEIVRAVALSSSSLDASSSALSDASSASAQPRIALVIGPEGGFAVAEVAQMRESGAHVASLGESILRTETAAIAALAITLYHLGGLGAR